MDRSVATLIYPHCCRNCCAQKSVNRHCATPLQYAAIVFLIFITNLIKQITKVFPIPIINQIFLKTIINKFSHTLYIRIYMGLQYMN